MVKNQKQKLSPIPKSMEATVIPAIQLDCWRKKIPKSTTQVHKSMHKEDSLIIMGTREQ